MIDLDHFKAVNDTYGHAVGNKVLHTTAQRLLECLRPEDFLGRMGREEFAVFLHNCRPIDALSIAERIRQSLKSTPIEVDEQRSVPVTVSIGIALTDATGQLSLDDLLLRADTALYNAKSQGRNRVEVAEESER